MHACCLIKRCNITTALLVCSYSLMMYRVQVLPLAIAARVSPLWQAACETLSDMPRMLLLPTVGRGFSVALFLVSFAGLVCMAGCL